MGHLQAIEAVSPSDTHSRDLWAEFDNHTGGSERGSQQIFTIRDLAREFGVTARTLRFYEEKELLSPRRQGQERLYSRRDRARLKLVLMGKRVGFSLEEIRSMLDLYDLGDGRVTQLKVSYTRFNERIERLKQQRDEIDEAIAAMQRASKSLAEMLKERGAAVA
ncbi:MAG: MerR family DNA-binding transcriptional regulator [Xanthobacteraceae bacterium]|jgi:DNA-binding transcriptional MerR regulator